MIIFINIIGGLGLFLFGMMVMSEGLQKVAGKRLRAAMGAMTANRFVGVLTGFGVTGIIQSSSATTVMLVSFVNAGLITLTQSIGVIMGANIGTTVTGWLVALLGFKMQITLAALVATGVGFFLRMVGKKSLPYWGEVLLGFGLLFIGLEFMKDAMTSMKGAPFISAWMSRFSANSIPSMLAAVGVGTLVTMIIQSSSATMALTMTLAAQGLIDFPAAAALILGENIGTTITANLAAIGASRNAKRAALAHFLFNMTGVLWMTFVFQYFLRFIDGMVPGDFSDPTNIPGHMAAFHSLFNIVNTILFLPLVSVLVNAVNRMIPKRKQPESETLTYIQSRLVATPSLALESTRMELNKMIGDVITMFRHVMETLNDPNEIQRAYGSEVNRIEESTDRQKELITEFLRNVLQHSTSEKDGAEVTRVLSHVSDLERIGDHCRNLFKLITRIDEQEIGMPGEAHQDLLQIGQKCMDFLQLIQTGLKHSGRNIMVQAKALEEEINMLRARGRDNHRKRLMSHTCDVVSGFSFLDMMINFEKIGDHAFNIAQRTSGVR